VFGSPDYQIQDRHPLPNISLMSIWPALQISINPSSPIIRRDLLIGEETCGGKQAPSARRAALTLITDNRTVEAAAQRPKRPRTFAGIHGCPALGEYYRFRSRRRGCGQKRDGETFRCPEQAEDQKAGLQTSCPSTSQAPGATIVSEEARAKEDSQGKGDPGSWFYSSTEGKSCWEIDPTQRRIAEYDPPKVDALASAGCRSG